MLVIRKKNNDTFDWTLGSVVAAFGRVGKTTARLEAFPIDGSSLLVVDEHNVRVVVDARRNDRLEFERIRIQVVEIEHAHSFTIRVYGNFASNTFILFLYRLNFKFK